MRTSLALAVLAGLFAPAALAQQPSPSPPQGAGQGTPGTPAQTAPQGAQGAAQPQTPAQKLPAHESAEEKQSLSTAEFVNDAAVSGMFEIQSSELALQKSKNDQVRQFAQRMKQDHTKADNELQSLVDGHALSTATSRPAGAAPSTVQAPLAVKLPSGLDPAHTQMLDQLRQANGEAFDKLYAQMQLQAHQKAVALFERYAQTGGDTEIRALAHETVPILQDHLQMAEKLVGAEKAGH